MHDSQMNPDGCVAAGVLLGDISLNNFLYDPDTLRVSLIDVETAALPGEETAAVHVVTPGYAAPQRFERPELRASDDAFSVGASLLSLLVPLNHIRILQPDLMETLLERVAQDAPVGDAWLSVVRGLLDDDEAARLTLDAACEALATALAAESGGPPRVTLERPEGMPAALPHGGQGEERATGDERLLRFLEETAAGTARQLVADATIQDGDSLFPTHWSGDHCALGYAYGALGITGVLLDTLGELPKRMTEWIGRKVGLSIALDPPGLYDGLAGVAHGLWIHGYEDAACAALSAACRHGSALRDCTLFSGAAGIGMAAFEFFGRTRDQRWLDWAVNAGEWLWECRTPSEMGSCWPSDDGLVHLGYLHGASGVAAFFLRLLDTTSDQRYLTRAIEAIQFDIDKGEYLANGGLSFPGTVQRTSSPGILRPYLEYGSAGILVVASRLAHATHDDTWADLATSVAKDVERSYSVNAGLFMGLSGMGCALLEAYDVLGLPEFLQASRTVAKGLALHRLKRLEGYGWPGDLGIRRSCEFAGGAAGVLVYLRQLLGVGHVRPLLGEAHIVTRPRV